MLVTSVLAKQQFSKLNQAIIQLTGLGMFFAFISCEYLKVLQAEQRQMEQLCMRNIHFLKERILDITLMSDATSLACYWPFDWPMATSKQYQRGRAPSRTPGSAALFATLLW
jgi:hypothetical protein